MGSVKRYSWETGENQAYRLNIRKVSEAIKKEEQLDGRYFIQTEVSKELNKKAKVVSHCAYGFRTAETYKLALCHCLRKLPKPETNFKFL